MSNTTELGSSMPLPPMNYINQYTDENIKKGRAPKPPPPPAHNETYSMFGVDFHAEDAIIRPLESQGIRRLYPQNFDHRRELKKLNHSVLVNFLDLLDIIIRCPDSPKRMEKIDDISLIFTHMHHLLNEFRPHQARETIRVMMDLQKRNTLETCDRFQKHLEHCVDIIKDTLNNIPDGDEEDNDMDWTTIASSDSKSPAKVQDEMKKLSSQDQLMCAIVDSM